MVKRHEVQVFGLTFLDAMTCGLGAVVLLYLIINGRVHLRKETLSKDLQAQTDRLEREVLEGHRHLVELRNSLREDEQKILVTQGLSRRLLTELTQIQEELATHEATTLAQKEHVNRLKSDLKTLETQAKRLSASVPSDQTPGRRIRSFVGDGDRQYLTGLKLGGKRILILVDVSASMLDESLVNIIRLRNMDDTRKKRAQKWMRTVATVDWLTTQLPADARIQVYAFAESTHALIPESRGHWLDAGDPAVLDQLVRGLKATVPGGGTNLQDALRSIAELNPQPDNLILLTDGLPTRGAGAKQKSTISADARLKLFNQAAKTLPARLPVNVILFPMEGDPMAAGAFWKLAFHSGGSFFCPSKDWP